MPKNELIQQYIPAYDNNFILYAGYLKLNLNFKDHEISNLIECGLLNSDAEEIYRHGIVLGLKSINGISIVALTKAGYELSQLVECVPNPEYVKYVNEKLAELTKLSEKK